MIKRLLFTLITALALALPAAAQDFAQGSGQYLPGQVRLGELYTALANAANDEWQVIEAEIRHLWSQSGSPSMDLLLNRGREALVADEPNAAIEHLTALIDHAPGFAEAWNARATAYFVAGLYGPALADLRQTLLLEPRHFGALAGLGMIFEEMGKAVPARHAFREALKLHPHREDVLEALRRIERALGEVDT